MKTYSSAMIGVALFAGSLIGFAAGDAPAPVVPEATLSGMSQEDVAADYPEYPGLQNAFADFAATPGWHGAFAIGDNGYYGWTTGYGTAEAAWEGALARCRCWTEHCQIVAEITPDTPLPGKAPQMSRTQAWILAQIIREYSGGRAVAGDAQGSWGSSWSHASKADAEAAAIARCAARAGDEQGETGCKVLWSGS
ncbi:DUF4189 domain-containing protein [Vannielia sp.]|uniref:DUF4189 domain-containing protein n=1 Tax=Vannielia sp. TaxID=2813045 RepID=UPI0026023D92|nr:DUF4189 domain-containing protein [Vannielia sp.]MDF1872156.1 DUF4189 domain-containing protein [Vannielia sp.]